ncbi:MAG: hypothetical protein IKL01_09075 [Mailhella sp.]|nr:hypothetical protein [Mailhella sp.]
MNKQKNSFTCRVAVVAGLAGIISFCNAANAVEIPVSDAGVMRIVMQHPDKAEMPAVTFDHEAHVAKLEKDGADCTVCHTALGKKDAKGMKPFAVVRSSKGKTQLMESWHKSCLDCHAKYSKAPDSSSCRTCHDADAAADQRAPLNFDRALHAAHVNSKHIAAVAPAGAADAANVKNCGACHVSVDANGKAYYAQNTEDAHSFFRTDSGDARELASIAHNTCVSCHIDTMKNGGPNAKALKLPVNCSDCHSTEAQAKFAAAGDFRLFRGQPDVIVLGEKPADAPKSQSSAPEAAIKPVAFDHKLHEFAADCGVCHGMKIEKDESGKPATLAGKGLSAYAAAHDMASASSCVGCHATVIAEDKNCSGCHADLKFAVKDSCSVCHSGAPKAVAKDFPAFPETKKVAEPIDPNSVPEKVTIGVLSNEYQAAVLPHRQIYKAMLDGMKGSKLAAAFHQDSVCKACHHNIPNDNIANPPSCASCHDKEVKAVTVGQVPSLKAAYHQMCISCHSSMNVKPDYADCAGCHEPVAAKDTNKNKREVR